MRRVVGMVTGVGLLLVAFTFPLHGQAGSLRGTISDSAGARLAGVTVSIEGTLLRVTSANDGTYQVRGVPAGTYAIRARLIGYSAAAARKTFAAGESATQDFTLGKSVVQLAPIDVVVGSRARHTAAEELAVPVDVYTAEEIKETGSTETSQILQALSPSVNFPRQSVTDATDIVRPFTLRGLSPDHTLVLVNGWRQHQMALVNTFAYGMGAGSSGVDLNAIPASAIDRIEVLRDGAAAQYGSDAIAGVVNIVTREGPFTPFIRVEGGQYFTGTFPDDGTTLNVNGGVGLLIGRASLGLFAEYRDRDATNRAWADPFETSGTGIADSIDADGQVVEKRNPVDQPNHHWGDGEAKDLMTFANLRLPMNPAGTSEIYVNGGYSFRQGTGNGYRRYETDARNWPQIYQLGFLPTFDPDVTDYSGTAGFRAATGGWTIDLGATFGHNDFEYNLSNTLNVSLGPCLTTACAPGLDGIPGNADDPGIPNQTSFFAGRLLRRELVTGVNVAREINVGLPAPVNLAMGVAFRQEWYKVRSGEFASYVDGGNPDQFGDDATGGSQVFPGFAPSDAVELDRNNIGFYLDLESNLARRLLVNIAGRFESYSDFGERLTGKLALRYQPTPRLTLRGAASTGFRAPGLSQIAFSKVTTNFIFDPGLGRPVPEEIGVYRADHPAAVLLGSQPLTDETSVNLSAGLAFSPRDNFTITLDYFHIDIDDRVLLGATFDDDTTQAILQRNGFDDIGGVQYFTNGLDTRTQGVDLIAALRLPAGASGRLDFNLGVNYTKNQIVRVDPLPAILANSDEPGLLDVVTEVGIEEERPDWRATLQAQYTLSRFRSLARVSYFGGFASAQPGFCDVCRETYGGKTVFDAEIGYQFNFLGIAVGARNLFDTYPDKASDQNSFGIFPWAAASPFGYNGRFVYVRSEVLLGR